MASIRRVAGGIVVAVAVVQAAIMLGFATMGGYAIRRPLDLLGVLGIVAGLLMPLAFILIGLRLLRAPLATARENARPRTKPPAIAPPAPEDVADLRGPLTACPDCGFLGVRMPQLGDGLWPGGGELGDRKVCPRCDYQGLAVQFDSGEEYAAYLRALAHDRAPPGGA